jgi:hypothetical protein
VARTLSNNAGIVHFDITKPGGPNEYGLLVLKQLCCRGYEYIGVKFNARNVHTSH